MPSALEKKIVSVAKAAREASLSLAKLPTEAKNRLLTEIADELVRRKDEIQESNRKDLKTAEKQRLPKAMVDRLTLNDRRIEEMARGLKEVAELPDPVGTVVKTWGRPNGLVIRRVRIPLGVIGIIYESRPNVTVDAAGLCLKSGNAVVLRGGSEAIHSNVSLGKIVRNVLKKNGVDPNAVQVVDTPDREAMKLLVKQSKYIDLMIPRGGGALMAWMEEHSKIPVIKHDKGVCHVYVDESADFRMAEKIVLNAKVQRPGVCNALETLLVNARVAPEFLPGMVKRLQEAGVEIRGDEKTRLLAPGVKRAAEKDWGEEYLDLILAVKVVPDLEEAIRHIQKYGSMHTETIVTQDEGRAREFLDRLDSSVVLWNASTRFSDGGQLGL
ncbi:MAG TPA: glutamate-5-semialdehyde dehydrogenase, partial [bacterium]|nr:glutamate-5-semialdehyde dehydrogenase [bacterium]